MAGPMTSNRERKMATKALIVAVFVVAVCCTRVASEVQCEGERGALQREDAPGAVRQWDAVPSLD